MGNTKSAANVPPHMEFVLRRKRVSDALLRGLDKLIDHAEFLTFSNDSFMLFAMAFQLTLQQWLVHMAKYISPNVKRRSAEGGLPSELVEQHKHAMMAVQKFQALMLDNQGEQHGIAVCQKNQEALRELRDVIRRLVVNEAKVLTVSMISELFSSDELLELQAAMDTFAAQRGDQLLVLPFVHFQLDESEQKEMVERLSWADKRKLHEGTEKYTDTWRFSHNAPTKPLQEKTIFESSCCACRKGPRPFATKTPPPADRPKR